MAVLALRLHPYKCGCMLPWGQETTAYLVSLLLVPRERLCHVSSGYPRWSREDVLDVYRSGDTFNLTGNTFGKSMFQRVFGMHCFLVLPVRSNVLPDLYTSNTSAREEQRGT